MLLDDGGSLRHHGAVHGRRATRSGAKVWDLWALALVLHTATHLLFTLRGGVTWASAVLANTLLAGTFALALAAVRQFQAMGCPGVACWCRCWPWRCCLPWFQDDYRACVIVAGVVPPLQVALVLWALWRPAAGANAWRRLADRRGWACGPCCWRARCVLRRPCKHPHPRPAAHRWRADSTFMAAFVVVILASLGFILMARDGPTPTTITLPPATPDQPVQPPRPAAGGAPWRGCCRARMNPMR